MEPLRDIYRPGTAVIPVANLQAPRESATYDPLISGGEGDRTPDLVNAIHALSQLSYAPYYYSRALRRRGSTKT
jgi:hypothetical protein